VKINRVQVIRGGSMAMAVALLACCGH